MDEEGHKLFSCSHLQMLMIRAPDNDDNIISGDIITAI